MRKTAGTRVSNYLEELLSADWKIEIADMDCFFPAVWFSQTLGTRGEWRESFMTQLWRSRTESLTALVEFYTQQKITFRNKEKIRTFRLGRELSR